jgi:hypothetical protein
MSVQCIIYISRQACIVGGIPEHFTGRAGLGPGRKKTRVFRAEKILPTPVPWAAAGLVFRVGLGPCPGLGGPPMFL